MLHLIPAPLHRLLYRLAHGLRKIWLHASKAQVHGCCMIAQDGDGRFLLVMHSYGARAWAFPGGGLRKGEDPELAVLREFSEEVSSKVSDVQFLGQQCELYQGTTNHVHVFTSLIDGVPKPDHREIVEARFFSLEEFPQNLSGTVPKRMELLQAQSQQ